MKTMTRSYRLGRRQASVDRTSSMILASARELAAQGRGPLVSVGEVARRAGVSRITVYNRFRSREGLMQAIAPRPPGGDTDDLRQHLQASCSAWAANPALFRNLRPDEGALADASRRIAASLASSDALRPGCSLKEAEDVIAVLSSFPVFDRLHKDGRRSASAVSEILIRLASAILA